MKLANWRAQTETLVGTLMLVGGIAVGLLVFTLYLSTLAQDRQTTISGQLGMQESRTSYRNLFEVQDEFGNKLGDLMSAAVATGSGATLSVVGDTKAKSTIVKGTPCGGGTVMYPTLCCGPVSPAESITFVANAVYEPAYGVTNYDLLKYLQCYLIPKTFYPIFGNNYKVSTKMGTKTLETGNTLYSKAGEKFYIAAPGGNTETLVEVTITGAVQ